MLRPLISVAVVAICTACIHVQTECPPPEGPTSGQCRWGRGSGGSGWRGGPGWQDGHGWEKNPEARVELPRHFALVTNAEGLTVQLTPVGGWLRLYVAEKTPGRIVIREAMGKDGRVDYLVQGIRKGYENHRVIRDRTDHAEPHQELSATR